MSLLEEALLLQRAAHDLMYLGMDGSPIYSDDLSRRNGEVYHQATTLYNSGIWGTTMEEQANVCLALLMGYSASFIDHGEKQQHVQEALANEARSIIASWDAASLTAEQQEAIDEFQNVVDNPYPWEYIDE